MIIHPDLRWLQEIERNVQDDEWRQDNLDPVIESLGYYLSSAEFAVSASGILDICCENMMGLGRYTELVNLLSSALETFEDDPPLKAYPDQDLLADPPERTNIERFPDEYFKLKLNIAHATLLLHHFPETTDHLTHIYNLLSTTNLVNQFRAFFLFLKFHSYGQKLTFELDFVKAIQQLAAKIPSLKLEAQIAIAYFHYANGDLDEMKKTMHKVRREIGKYRPTPSEISKITAELYFYLAVVYRELGQYDEAFKNLDIASEQYARVNNYVQNMLVLNETSLLYRGTEQLDKALQWNDLAYREFAQFDDPQEYYRAMLDHTRGTILFDMQQYREAESLFEKVCSIWEKHDHKYHIALAKNALGAAINKLNRHEEALKHLKEARALCQDMTDKEYVSELLKVIDSNINEACGKQ